MSEKKDAEAGITTYVQPTSGYDGHTPPNEKVAQGEDDFGMSLLQPFEL